jgi:hypothetical protein
MKNQLKAVVFVAFFHATPSLAVPILSADGSILTAVDVDGTLYDVMFGDGPVDEVFADVTFDAARETITHEITVATIEALNIIGGVAPDDIAGCRNTQICNLFNPDSFGDSAGGPAYIDNHVATGRDPADPWHTQRIISVLTGFDTANSSFVTLLTYSLAAPVSVPATLGLFGLGLAGLGFSCRKKDVRGQPPNAVTSR